jgi:outer membrane protein assembly factor BamD (BamD/ComL family)
MRRFAEATRLYRALQASFPASEEARLAWLSLADLYLSRGRALEALTEFDGYLASGDAVLEEEALVGRARALARLGARAKERATWKELLAKHPRSAYAWRARQRLQELDASDP